MACSDCRFESRHGPKMCVSCECCMRCLVLSLRGVDHSSRGVVPKVVGLRVIIKPQELEGLGPIGLQSYEKFVYYLTHKYHSFSTQKLLRTVSKYQTRCVSGIKDGKILTFPKITLWLCDRILCLPNINDSERNDCADVRSLIPKFILP